MKSILKRIKNKIFNKNKLSKKEQRHKLVGAPKNWKMKQDFQIKFLIEQGLDENDKFLDIGCGTLRGGIPIINHLNEGNYYGIDVRSNVIDEARKELKQEKLIDKNPKLFAFNEFSELKLDTKFDVIFAYSVLIHLSDDILEECIKFVSNNISNEGVFYANINTVENVDGNWQGFPVVFRPIEFYKAMAEKFNLKLEVIGQLKDLGHISNKELGDKQLMVKLYN